MINFSTLPDGFISVPEEIVGFCREYQKTKSKTDKKIELPFSFKEEKGEFDASGYIRVEVENKGKIQIDFNVAPPEVTFVVERCENEPLVNEVLDDEILDPDYALPEEDENGYGFDGFYLYFGWNLLKIQKKGQTWANIILDLILSEGVLPLFDGIDLKFTHGEPKAYELEIPLFHKQSLQMLNDAVVPKGEILDGVAFKFYIDVNNCCEWHFFKTSTRMYCQCTLIPIENKKGLEIHDTKDMNRQLTKGNIELIMDDTLSEHFSPEVVRQAVEFILNGGYMEFKPHFGGLTVRLVAPKESSKKPIEGVSLSEKHFKSASKRLKEHYASNNVKLGHSESLQALPQVLYAKPYEEVKATFL